MVKIDGVIRKETPEELADRELREKRKEAEERHRPLSDQEVDDLLRKQLIQSLAVDDATAVRMRDRYPEWDSLIGQTATAGMKFQHGGELYEVNAPGGHTFSATWIPGQGTESLYRLIPELYAGDEYDPIPYNGNMTLEQGKYYTQDKIMYYCWNGSGQPVFDPLSTLQAFVRVVKK